MRCGRFVFGLGSIRDLLSGFWLSVGQSIRTALLTVFELAPGRSTLATLALVCSDNIRGDVVCLT